MLTGAEPQMTDQAISDRVEDELAIDPLVLSPEIDVQSSDGIVTLDGTAGNLSSKDRASRIAETVQGGESELAWHALFCIVPRRS